MNLICFLLSFFTKEEPLTVNGNEKKATASVAAEEALKKILSSK